MSAPSWMLLRVALETRAHHSIADEQRLAVMEAQDRGHYRRFLQRVYGFESVFEDGLARSPDLDAGLVRGALKMPRLRLDLAALGIEARDVDMLPSANVPSLRTAAQALGWMF